jgi:hypothetical protein
LVPEEDLQSMQLMVDEEERRKEEEKCLID